jgi:opacity protein-like surface antigen
MLKKLVIAGSLAFLACLASTAKAQALPTALAKGELQIGGGYSIASSDYGQRKIEGLSGFADFDILAHWGVEGDIHAVTIWTPDDIAEASYLVGPRFIYRRRNIKLYAKALAGVGSLIIQNPQYHPYEVGGTNFAYALGGGIDIVVKPYLTVRAVDAEYQHFNYQTGLTPIVFTFGAAYRFH